MKALHTLYGKPETPEKRLAMVVVGDNKPLTELRTILKLDPGSGDNTMEEQI